MREQHKTRRQLLLQAGALGAVTLAGARALAGDGRGSYGLDHLSRNVEGAGRLKCPDVPLTDYRGTTIAYAQFARVYQGFVPRLQRFEQVAAAVATATYGRPPRRLRHMGAFNCRRIKKFPQWYSEHAFGNAIDVEGFDFAAASAEQPLPSGLHRVFGGAFSVRVLPHWKQRVGLAAVHANFLRQLGRALAARRDIFRVLLGPNFAGHHNHMHFDCAPWRMVRGFADRPA